MINLLSTHEHELQRRQAHRHLAQLTVNAVYFLNTALHIVSHTNCNHKHRWN
uniref:Uncharacterized protein n=1 Tax=Arundo donax TaxID=35708 RepID=A0A0A8YZ82_ARUDO